MKLKRIWVLFVARNYEFIRDRAGFGWNILFPFLIVVGFGIMFNSDTRSDYKLGVWPLDESLTASAKLFLPPKIENNNQIQIVPFASFEKAEDRLLHHKIDLLIENSAERPRYWINDASPKGEVLEKMVKEAFVPESFYGERIERRTVQGDTIRYIDWLFPGILGMNIMFSSLFGVGYVIVRYRRSGVLKRLKATPVTAFEYLTAQMASRVVVLMSTSALVWFGCDFIFSFSMKGSYLDAFVVFLAGTVCMICLGLVLACRGTNEELTNGIINFICWPMMFLSEVWFSIEGTAGWVKSAAKVLPLTHFLNAARMVINDGAVLSDVTFEIAVLIGLSLVFLFIGSLLFSWTK
jgi:ABC-2 type transport system permease protein